MIRAEPGLTDKDSGISVARQPMKAIASADSMDGVSAARVEFESVTKRFGNVQVLTDFSLEVAPGIFLVVLGPSGCGKTTALRVLAGLEQPTSGRVLIGDEDVTNVSPRHRNVAMVFQSYALYPHMDVEANIGYPLKVRGVSNENRRTAVMRVAALVGSKACSIADPVSCQGGSVSASRSQERWFAIPLVSSWTSRSRTSTHSSERRCGVS